MSSLPDYDATDRGLERLSPDERARLQDERLRAMLRYAIESSPFWRRKLAGVALDAVTGVGDLAALPFTTRRELEDDQRDHPPFGSYACSRSTVWRWLFATSGTGGGRLLRIYSGRDWELLMDRFARHPVAQPGERVMVLAPADGLLGPTASIEAARRAGALPILAGPWDTRTRARMIEALRPAVISGAASYLVHLSEVAAELGVALSVCGIRRVSSVGEPGAAVPATRALLRERFGTSDIVDGYGMTELFPLGGSCPQSRALHIAEDFVAVECVDPDTGAAVPEGEPGELVYTNLIGDTQPLIRYRSGDIGRLQRSPRCECGSTVARVERIEGRADQMIWYRGINFFPSAVEQVVRSAPGLASGEYRIVLDRGQTGLPEVTVEVEAAAEDSAFAGESLRRSLHTALGAKAAVAVLAPGSLPRAEGRKASRILDRCGEAPTRPSRMTPTEAMANQDLSGGMK